MFCLLRMRAGAYEHGRCGHDRSEKPSQVLHRLPLDFGCFLSSSHRGCRDVNSTSGGEETTQLRDGERNDAQEGERDFVVFTQSSSSAKADDPVRRGRSALSSPPRSTAYFPLARMKSKSQPSSACRIVSLNRCA